MRTERAYMLEKREEVLTGEVALSKSSDEYVAEQFEAAYNSVHGTVEPVVDIAPQDLLKPHSLTVLSQLVEDIPKPVFTEPVEVDGGLSHEDSLLAFQLRKKRVHQKNGAEKAA